MLPDIKSFTRDELAARLTGWGQSSYRVNQLMEWLYRRRAADWEAMTNLPAALRTLLREHFSLRPLELVRKQGARDATQKFLWRLADGSLIESVLIPANPSEWGETSDRRTLCVSTQVGCAYGCRFCASGLDGWKRNLEPHEIVEQVLAVERWHAANPDPAPAAAETTAASRPTTANLINNLVIMGMGEPLANYDHLLKALRILNAPWGGNIGARRITISTSGLAPQIRRLAGEPEQFRLAISLHGATDEVRARIMPVNRKYPLAELAKALGDYQRAKDQVITFEYILIAGVNDDPAQAAPLAELARRLNAKVNLIPYNKVEDLPWSRPAEDVCENFLAALKRFGTVATLRREKGHDIDAACGQLRLKTERELAVRPG